MKKNFTFNIPVFAVWAGLLSYSTNESIWLGLFHSLFGIFYVIYHVIKY